MKPIVGVTAWRRTLDTYYGPDRLQTLAAYYSDSLLAAGMLPMIIPNGQDPDNAEKVVASLDGVLVSGGDDLDPATYGEEPTASKRYDGEVDRFEIAVVESAHRQGKPLLAICRGLQLLNVAMGGTLAQEVTSSDAVHGSFTDATTPEEMNARRHVVRFEPGSLLSGLYGAEEAKVNTLHHQGIDLVGDGLVVEARTDDDLVEAVRYDGDWWALAVQWHPERMDGEHQRVFEVFREAIQRRASAA